MIKNYFYITFIFGTRPEAIKLAPVILAFKENPIFKVKVIFTGQHKEMALSVLDLFNISIDIDLNIMRESQTLSYLTSKLVDKLSKELCENKSNLVFVQGDTTSAFIGALASFYEKIPVAHIEAGLRTNNIYEPFPEEANRKLISQIASLNFAPTKLAFNNLLNESIIGKKIITGNTVIDALKIMEKKIANKKFIGFDFLKSRTILLTVHRRENWGENLLNILTSVNKIISENPNISFLIPMHKNQRVRGPIQDYFGNNKKVFLLEPLKYDEFVMVMKKCFFIMTDSGGIQEEATAFGKPVLVLRNKTERMEAVSEGSTKLVGTDPSNIYLNANKLINDESYFNQLAVNSHPYGDGNASEKILFSTLEFLNIN